MQSVYYMLIRVVVSLVRPQVFKAGKRAPAFFALPLLGLCVVVRFERVLADAVCPCPVIVGNRVMIDSVLDAAQTGLLIHYF